MALRSFREHLYIWYFFYQLSCGAGSRHQRNGNKLLQGKAVILKTYNCSQTTSFLQDALIHLSCWYSSHGTICRSVFTIAVTCSGTPQVPLLLHAAHTGIKGLKPYLVSLFLSNTEHVTHVSVLKDISMPHHATCG